MDTSQSVRITQTGDDLPIDSFNVSDSSKITAWLATIPTPPRLPRYVYTKYYNVSNNLFDHIHDLAACSLQIKAVFKQMLEPIIAEAKEDDMVSVTIDHEEMWNYPVNVNYVKKGSIDFGRLFERMKAEHNQSNSGVRLTGRYLLQVAIL